MRKKLRVYVPALLGAFSMIYYGICIRDSGWDTSGLWVWPLFALLCFLYAGMFLRSIKRGTSPERTAAGRMSDILIVFLFASFFIFETGVVWGMHQHGEKSPDTILILGGGVVGSTPSPALEARIETAGEYLKTHPGTNAVACGGLEDKDTLSEAVCIENGLLSMGIAADRIKTEEHSSTTAENMRFSRRLVEEDVCVGIVTSNFHVFRSVLLARAAGYFDVCGIAAPFGGRMLPHYMVREFMTFTAELFRGNLL